MRKIPVKPLLVGLLLLVLVITAGKFLVVTEVECLSDSSPCPQEFTQMVDSLKGHSLLIPKSQSDLDKLFSTNISYKSSESVYEFPSKLIVNLSLRKPVAAIATDIQGQDAMIISDDGVILGPINDSNYPLLVDEKFLKDSKTVSTNLVLAAKILYQVNTLVKSRVWGNLEGEVVTATYANGPKILISITSDINNWYSPLQQIIERSKISSNKQPVKIDLRFTNPVLTY